MYQVLQEAGKPIHIDLDTEENFNYFSLKETNKRGFQIKPNAQWSKLGDGKPLLPNSMVRRTNLDQGGREWRWTLLHATGSKKSKCYRKQEGKKVGGRNADAQVSSLGEGHPSTFSLEDQPRGRERGRHVCHALSCASSWHSSYFPSPPSEGLGYLARPDQC